MPVPPSKPPSKPGTPAARAGLSKPTAPAEDAIQRSKREKDELEKEAQAVEEELEALKARYDQYFLGLERREPSRWREELKKKVLRLKGGFTRNTGLKFKIQSLHARFLSYERLWLRSAREREEGTYRRDLFKARLRSRHDEAATAPEPAAEERGGEAGGGKAKGAADSSAPAAPAKRAEPAPPPVAKPAAAAKPPATPAAKPSAAVAAADGMSENAMRTLYNAYLAAKMTCHEDVSKLTYDAVARSVTKQIPELMARYKAKAVEFKVEVKDGKAVLKAVPKI